MQSELTNPYKRKTGTNDIFVKSIITIEEGQRQGIIRKGNPMALAMTFWLSIEAYVEMITLNPDIPYSETNWFVDILRESNNYEK